MQKTWGASPRGVVVNDPENMELIGSESMRLNVEKFQCLYFIPASRGFNRLELFVSLNGQIQFPVLVDVTWVWKCQDNNNGFVSQRSVLIGCEDPLTTCYLQDSFVWQS